MGTWMKVTLGLVIGGTAVFCGGGKLLPSKVEMTTQKTVVAPHDHMSAMVASPNTWQQWSVWAPLVAKAKKKTVTKEFC